MLQGRSECWTGCLSKPVARTPLSLSTPPPFHPPPLFLSYLWQAFSADAILACVGESNFAEKPGDISELELPRGISAFVRDLRKVTDDMTPIVLALVEGRPRLLGDLPHTVKGKSLNRYTAVVAAVVRDGVFGELGGHWVGVGVDVGVQVWGVR